MDTDDWGDERSHGELPTEQISCAALRRWKGNRESRSQVVAGRWPTRTPPSPQQTSGGREYSTLTALKCVCSTCRDLGFVGYELWRKLIKALVGETTPTAKRLLAAIDEEERYRAGEFLTHLTDESSCASHCLGHLLSAFNNECFRQDCVHGRHDGKNIAPAISMSQRAAPRQAPSSDWSGN